MPDISVEEAVKQNCQAVLTGDLLRIMTDLTPDALGAVMANAGGGMGAMPALTSFDIRSHDVNGDDHVFKIQFKEDQDFLAIATWKDVAGAWKITDLKMEQQLPDRRPRARPRPAARNHHRRGAARCGRPHEEGHR